MAENTTKIKICGLTTGEDILAVNETKPDYIGFVFAESKRKVSPGQAKMLKQQLDSTIQTVGVFVKAEIGFIQDLCKEGIIDIVQLHGDESEGYIAELKKAVPNPIIKAIRISKQEDIRETTATYTLFDTYNKDHFGGTGESFNWHLVKGYPKPFFLAGGLDTSNVQEAIEAVNPFCIDVSSGVETEGKKDKEKIISLIKMVRDKNKNRSSDGNE